MTSLYTVLHQSPWITYNDTLFHSRYVLTYPKNIIFTAQLLSNVHSLPVYQTFPSAERFSMTKLQNVDWDNSMIVFDSQSRVVIAPEPVQELIQLDRRLHYKEAFQTIFKPFHLLPTKWFRFQWWWITSLVLGWLLMTVWSHVEKRKPHQLVLSNKFSKPPNHNRA